MRATTKISWDMETGEILAHDWHEWTGPVDEMKKGRGLENQAGSQASSQYNTDTGVQSTANSSVLPFAQSLIPSSSGALSPYASAQYGQDVDNIANTYNSLRQAGFKALGATGFGNAPSGRESSMLNTIGNEQGNALTGAYRNALNSTYNQGVEGSNLLMGEQSLQNPNQAIGEEAGIGKNLNTMGSTLGDIATGLSTAVSLASGIAGLASGIPSLGSAPTASSSGTSGSDMSSIGSLLGSLYPPPQMPSIAPASSTTPITTNNNTNGFSSLWGGAPSL